MIVRRLIWPFVKDSVIAYCLLSVTPAAADSILAGTVTDAITQQPVAAAEVQIEYSGQTLGAGTADFDGVYRIPFTIPPGTPAVVSMIASARSAVHGVATSNFQVNGGTPVATTVNIALFPTGLAGCRPETNHSVIVGNFLPPDGRVPSDLSKRIALSLEFALNSRLESVGLTLALLPSFEPCDAAKPKTAKLGASFAKALRADAFVGGDITHAAGSPDFTVSFLVSDAYGLFANPQIASNKSVTLDSPTGASVSGETHAAVLAAIAAGLAARNDCVTAIAVLSVAERLVDLIPPYIKSLRNTCQSRVANVGLRRTP